MSQAVLVKTLVSWLNDKLGLRPGQCGVELPPGIPPPSAPHTVLTLVIGSTTEDSAGNSDFINEIYYVDVNVNRKTGLLPGDRGHIHYLEHIIGLEAKARQVIRALHGSEEFRIEASGLLPSGVEFSTPLMYQGMPPVRAFADAGSYANPDPDTWVVQTVPFRGMRRTQRVEVL